MRAAVWRTADQPVVVMDVDLAPPKAGEVEVAIAAAGVCHSDLHLVRGAWAVPTPVILGHEGSGIVTAVGAGVTGLAEGDHVVLSWVPSCGECRQCRRGRTSQCQTAATVTAPGGVLFDGTSRFSIGGEPAYHYCAVSSFAERVVVPASGAIRVRKDAPLDVIALVGCAVPTGVGAVLNTARVEAGATVAVIGCGGVGLCVIQGARLAGASRIIAVDIVGSKLDMALRLGATDSVNGSEVPVLEALADAVPEGLDYVFDAIGKIETTQQAIRAIGPAGAAVIVGLPPTGKTATFEPLAIAEANQRILGSNYGSTNAAVDFPRLVDLYMDGSLDLDALVTARRPLEEAREALENLAGGQVLRQLLVNDVSGL